MGVVYVLGAVQEKLEPNNLHNHACQCVLDAHCNDCNCIASASYAHGIILPYYHTAT